MKVTPLFDRVLVKRIEQEDKTKGGIVIPDSAQERPLEGKVLAVGRGKLNDEDGKLLPLDVKEGDRVLFSKWAGTEIKVDGEDCLILREEEVLAIVG